MLRRTGTSDDHSRFNTRQIMLLLVFAALTAVTLAAAHFSLSDNADLKHLSLSEGTLTPAFASGATSYTATVDNAVDEVDVTAVPSHAEAIMTVNGTLTDSGTPRTVPLEVGANEILISVTAEDGVTSKGYTVEVTRSDP